MTPLFLTLTIVLACIFLALVVLLLVWKFTKFGRLLRPRMRKHEVHLEDLIEPADAAHEMQEMDQGDVDLNPVVQARMIIEQDAAHGQHKQKRELRAGAAGALGRLLKGLGGSFGAGEAARSGKQTERTKRERLRALDRNLAREAQAAEATERRRKEDERIYRQAEQAALDAKRGRL